MPKKKYNNMTFGKVVSTEMKEGKPQKQAVAIAYRLKKKAPKGSKLKRSK